MTRKQRYAKNVAAMIAQERNHRFIKEESDAIVQGVYSSMALAIWDEYDHLSEEDRVDMIKTILHYCKDKWEELANAGYAPKKMARLCEEVTGTRIEVN